MADLSEACAHTNVQWAMPEIRKVDFNQLPQTVRERFVQCAQSQNQPVPILHEQLGLGMAIFGWGSLALCAGGGLLALLFAGWGRVYGTMALQGPAYIFIYVVAIFTGVYSVLAIIRRKMLLSALPFAPGRYLFPMDFVDARTSELKIIPMSSMVDFKGVHHHTNGVYTNTLFTFTFEGGHTETMNIRGRSEAESALVSLQVTQGEVADAIENRDVDALYALDIFLEARMNDWQPAEQQPFADVGAVAPGAAGQQFFGGGAVQSRPMPALLRYAALISLGLSVVVGVPTWLMRSRLGDDAVYKKLERSGSEYEVQAYVRKGGRHAKKAKKKLLPKVRLRSAKRKGTVTALRKVAKQYPKTKYEREARKEITKLFAKTIAGFNAQAADDAEMRGFMAKLFAQLEKSDNPELTVRFGKPSAKDLALADKILNKKVKGGVVPISGHFDDASSRPREEAIVRYLNKAFASIFPADIMGLKKGARLTAGNADGGLATPSIDINYEVSPSGDTYTSDRTKKNFVGIRVNFQVAMRVPGVDKPFSFNLKVEPPEHFQVRESSLGLGKYSGSSAGRVYHAMASHAFEQLASKLRAVFFRKGTKAFEGKGRARSRSGRRSY